MLSWVLYTVGGGRISRAHDSRVVTAWTLILGALTLLPMGLPAAMHIDLAAIGSEAWFGVAWLAICTSVVMMLLWNKLPLNCKPTR